MSAPATLIRFFLLGEALREQLDRPLVVISLTPDGLDDDLPRCVDEAVNLNGPRRYRRLTWGEVYKFIQQSAPQEDPIEQGITLRYLRGKTLGYDAVGRLQTLLP